MEHPGEGDGFTNVFDATEPGHHTFDAHPESGMRDASILAQVQIPLEGLDGKVVLLDAFQQQVMIVDSLAASHDFSVALRCQDIHA